MATSATNSGITDLRRFALRCVLSPVVRFCLRSSFALQDLISVAKELFVEFAAADLSNQGEKVNVSRLSVLTGIRRAEVHRLRNDSVEIEADSTNHFLMRLIVQWRNDPAFSTSPGEPKPLTFRGKSADFRTLCAKVSAAISAGTVQFECERRGLVERQGDMLVLLYRQLPLASAPRDGLELLAKDLDELLQAAEENLFSPSPITNLHLRTEFDNIEPRYLPTIRRWLLDEGKDFHARARDFLSQFDRDLNPKVSRGNSQKGTRVSVGTHSLTPLADEWRTDSSSKT